MLPIRLEKLTRRFGETVAVDDVTLEISPGELFFLLGPSGCGKTTLMRLIAGLLEPSGGRIRFADRDVSRLPTAKRNTALVFQGYALWPHMSVRQNVAFGLDVRGVPAEEKTRRIDEALAMVRMTDLAARRPMQLSGGQQQRVALARALVVNPDVLLLDEPLSNLDAKLRQRMRTEIRRICRDTGITTVYVTHDQEEALSIADRMAVLRDGRVCQVGKPHDLYRRPATRFVADFLGKANFIEAEVDRRDDTTVELTASVGRLRSAVAPDGARPGDQVTCVLRPECVRLAEDGHPPPDRDNTLEARHLETVYLGHLAQHVFEAAAGMHLAVEELRPPARRWGDRPVRLAFTPEDLIVLTE